MSSGTTALLNSAPMHFALAVNSELRSNIWHYHFDLPASIELIMLLLLCGNLVARFNSWDPHHLNESCPKISSWDYSCMSPHLSPGGIAACTPSAHLAQNFSAWVVSSTPWSLSCGYSTSRGSLLLAWKTCSLSSINCMSLLHFQKIGSSVDIPSTSSL